jgi:hypothetical protein
MPMPPYPIYCYQKGCGKPAEYKIASRWSDGATHELKTYALCCSECLPAFFHQSRVKNAACRRAPGETLGAPEIYALQRGVRDLEISRRPELEQQLISQDQSVVAP